MTTPIEDLVMPYGVTVEGNGSWWPAIVGAHPMKNTSSSLNLIPGPCRVSASWDGENAADLVLTTGGEVKRVAHIPAKNERGGGIGTVMVTIGARAGDRIELNVKSTAGETGTLEIYPMPT